MRMRVCVCALCAASEPKQYIVNGIYKFVYMFKYGYYNSHTIDSHIVRAWWKQSA